MLRRLPSPKVEATWIVEEIQRSKQLTGGVVTFADYAILLRSGSQSHAIELALGKAGIPYRMVGGHKFFDRLEIKVLINYLRVIASPQHNDAVMNVLNVPPRGIGDKTLKELTEEAERRKIPLWQLVLNAAQGRGKVETKLKTQAQKGVEAFVGIIERALNKINPTNGSIPATVADLIDFLLSRLSFESFLRKSHSEDFEARWENIEELRLQAAQLCSTADSADFDLEEALPAIDGIIQDQAEGAHAVLIRFLSNVALATDMQAAEEGQSTDQATISTMHAAKGLEWPVVFIPSVYDGSMPHSRADDHDEERRLLYVAMTRAQGLLYLSCPTKASSGNGANTLSLSPFLSQPAIARLFELRGPTFTFSTVQDLARILRRECPDERTLLDCYARIERPEDNYWPYDGQDIEPETSTWGLQSNEARSEFTFPSKRRRLEDIPEGARSWRTVPTAVQTTMQNDTAFSLATATISSGFVSANVRLKELATQGATKTSDIDTTKRTKPTCGLKTNASKKQPVSQGSLLTFFSKKSQGQCPLPIKAAPDPEGTLTGLAPDAFSLPTMVANGPPQPRTLPPMSAASQARKIRSTPLAQPVSIPTYERHDASRPYV